MKIRKIYFLWKIYQNQFKSKAALQQLQLHRLKHIIAHAYATVPYYRSLFREAGISPEDIRGLDDIKKIPITKKEDLQAQGLEQRLSSLYSRDQLVHFKTGGSTGKILDIFTNKAADDMRGANILRTYYANGYRPTDKLGILQFDPVQQKWFYKLGFMHKLEIPYQMPLKDQVELLQKENPEVLMGYPSRLSLIAQAISDSSIPGITPRLIFTNSETLNDKSKKDIVAAFGVQPVNVYDCWEFANIAWECERHEGLHINSDLFYVEIGGASGNASGKEPGEFIITDFFNRAMPFIRYASGDMGIKTDRMCSCGRGLPLIEKVIGRTVEKMIFSDGTAQIPTTPIAQIMINMTGIREYQTVQYKKGEIEMRVVPDERYTPDTPDKLKQRLYEVFPLEKVVITSVDAISRTPAGKLKTFISHIDSE